jgi:hypothetical protein
VSAQGQGQGRPPLDLDAIAARARAVTPTPEGHPLPGEYVVWCVVGGRYTASGTVHDARFLAEGPADALELCAEVRRVTAERDEARAWVRRLTAAERVLTCVYCGEAYPPGSPTHGADVLTAHVRTCAKHPMRAAEAEVERLRAAIADVVDFASLAVPGAGVAARLLKILTSNASAHDAPAPTEPRCPSCNDTGRVDARQGEPGPADGEVCDCGAAPTTDGAS